LARVRTTVTDAGESLGAPTGWVLLVSRDADFRAYGLPERGEIAIGRDATCEVVIDHEKISRRHAVLRLGDRWTLEDLGSRNGTQIRGAALGASAPAEFAPGEPFQIGPFTAVVLARAVSTVRAALGASHVTLDDPTLASPSPLVLSLAQSMVNVLVVGETGAGKEVLSSSIHRLSGRSGALVCINCAALSPQLLESELFGHERGAFTGAAQSKPGLLEAAAGGTVLFAEIGEGIGRSSSRPSSCGRSRPARCCASARFARSPSMSASWRPPTGICRRASPRAPSGATSSTVWPGSP